MSDVVEMTVGELIEKLSLYENKAKELTTLLPKASDSEALAERYAAEISRRKELEYARMRVRAFEYLNSAIEITSMKGEKFFFIHMRDGAFDMPMVNVEKRPTEIALGKYLYQDSRLVHEVAGWLRDHGYKVTLGEHFISVSWDKRFSLK